MPISFKSLSRELNTSQVFTTSGTWTAPAGVTYAQVQLRGGNGTAGSFYYSSDNGSNTGTAGGSTTAFGITAIGGEAGVSGGSSIGVSTQSQHDSAAGNGPATISAFVVTVPGTNYTITVGTGAGAFAVVSWAA